MQIGDLTEQRPPGDRGPGRGLGPGKSVEAVLTEASGLLSGLTRAAGVVLTAKSNVRLKHIEFVRLEPERALVVLVGEDGQVENRVVNVPVGLADLGADRGRRTSSTPTSAATRWPRRGPSSSRRSSAARPSSTS